MGNAKIVLISTKEHATDLISNAFSAIWLLISKITDHDMANS